MILKNAISFLLMGSFLGATAFPAVSFGQDAKFEDLVVTIDPSSKKDEAILLTDPLRFNKSWYDQVQTSFGNTSVGTALDLENLLEDWRLVAVRVVPCQPFGTLPKLNPKEFCWPQVRLVWQPMIFGLHIRGRKTRFFADDRALHAIYDPMPSAYAKDAKFSAALGAAKSASQGGTTSPTADQMTALKLAQVDVASQLLTDSKKLRGLAGAPLASAMKTFLDRWAPVSATQELTAFSLPEGREPPLLDEWVFLKFKINSSGKLEKQPMDLFSAHDGRKIVTLPAEPVGSQQRDDPFLYDWAANGSTSPKDLAEVESNTLIWTKDEKKIKERIADRAQILVPNTTCASCHKLNDLRFDFHNLSHLDDQSITISPRVRRDAELDLQWIQERLSPGARK